MKRAEILEIAKPILFNTEMVMAIMDGRKTVTRRFVRFPEGTTGHLSESGAVDHIWYPCGIKYPRYNKGDYLYVRETWNQLAIVDSDGYTHYDDLFYTYKADAEQPDVYDDNGFYLDDTSRKWKPSIHMPKEAARIFLKVTDVRVEYLQDITEEQAIKEGHKKVDCEYSGVYDDDGMSRHPHCIDCWEIGCEPPIVKFQYAWDDKIRNLKHSAYDLYCWDANPLVWVYEFEKVEVNQDVSVDEGN